MGTKICRVLVLCSCVFAAIGLVPQFRGENPGTHPIPTVAIAAGSNESRYSS